MIALIGPTPPPLHGVSLTLGKFMSWCHANNVRSYLVASNVPRDPGNVRQIHLVHVVKAASLVIKSVTLSVGRKRDHAVCLICATREFPFYRDIALALIFRALRRRIFVYIQGTEIASYSGGKRWLACLAFARFDKIYCTEALRDSHAFLNNKDSVSHIVANGVPDQISCDLDAKVRAYDPSAPRLLFLSNLYAAKGVSAFLATLKRLQSEGMRFTAEIAGAFTRDFSRDHVQNLLKEHGLDHCVTCLGPVGEAEKRALLSRNDILLFPSEKESFGNVVIEAMSAGVLVIANNTTSMDMILDDGRVGYILRPFNAEAAAGIVQRLDRDVFAARVAGARERYLAMFSIERHSTDLARVLGGDACGL